MLEQTIGAIVIAIIVAAYMDGTRKSFLEGVFAVIVLNLMSCALLYFT